MQGKMLLSWCGPYHKNACWGVKTSWLPTLLKPAWLISLFTSKYSLFFHRCFNLKRLNFNVGWIMRSRNDFLLKSFWYLNIGSAIMSLRKTILIYCLDYILLRKMFGPWCSVEIQRRTKDQTNIYTVAFLRN